MSMERKNSLSLNTVLLALIGFFATWGEGMQMVIANASTIYPVLIVMFMILNFNKFYIIINQRRIVPKEFKYLFLFILIHTLLYIIFNFHSLGFGTDVREANDEGFSYAKADSGVIIIRYFIFLLFCLYLTIAFERENKLRLFSLFYIIGFVGTIVLGGAFHGYENSLIRISGGLKDPNAMAFDAIISFLFSLFLYKSFKSKILNAFIVVFIIIEFLAIFLSFSRGAYLALAIFGVIYIYRKGIICNIWKLFLYIFLFALIGSIAIRTIGIDTELIAARFSYQEIEEKKGASRGYIWEAYLDNMDEYFITGTGIANSSKVLIGNKIGVSENYETHNLYLQFFVEYGIIGFVLYILYWKGFLSRYRKTDNSYFFLMSMGIVLLVVTLFLNIDKGRTFWIVLSVINFIWMNGKYKNRDTLRNGIIK